MSIGEDLYHKIVSGRISFIMYCQQDSKEQQKRELLARLYLSNNGKGDLYYYPGNRGRYETKDGFNKFEFYTEKI